MTIEFHWDKAKARQNLKKHGVSFEEATAAFYDPLSTTVIDDEHSREESRFILPSRPFEPWPLNSKIFFVAQGA